MRAKSLTPKQERFCLAYIETGNASEAYRIAYDAKGMKPESINRKAKELLDNGKITARLRAMAEKAGLTVERTLREVARIAYSDPRRLFREDGSLIPVCELDDDTAAAVASIEVAEMGAEVVERTRKIKFLDKNSALDKAMKHLGLFKADNDQKPLPGSVSIHVVGIEPAARR